MFDDFDRCYRAVQSKDARFDGWFVTAVLTTRIYCRPELPGPAPEGDEHALLPDGGRRAARRLPGLQAVPARRVPGLAGVERPRRRRRPGDAPHRRRRGRPGRASQGLAGRLGYSTRQVERHLLAEVGAGPLALARAQRAQTARLLIETSDLPFAERRLRRRVLEHPPVQRHRPTRVRPHPDRAAARGSAPPTSRPGVGIALELRLPFRIPFCPDNLFGHLAATAVPGCEELRDGAYRRTHAAAQRQRHRLPDAAAPTTSPASSILDDLRDVPTAITRCRRLLDLDADPEAVTDALAADPLLEPLVAEGARAAGARAPSTRPSSRVRAVLGQQVSTAAARTHAARLVVAHGTPIERSRRWAHPRVPVDPEALAGARSLDAPPCPRPVDGASPRSWRRWRTARSSSAPAPTGIVVAARWPRSPASARGRSR